MSLKLESVNMASASGNETHVAAEVLWNRKRIISDPTFNVSFVDRETGEFVNFDDLQNRPWEEFQIVGHGYEPLPGRSLKEYPIPYKSMLFQVIYPYSWK